jgi:hypothetical protein
VEKIQIFLLQKDLFKKDDVYQKDFLQNLGLLIANIICEKYLDEAI